MNESFQKEHLSRRSASNNMSMLDSDAQSLPQGTYAIKAGPQTMMSQWVVTLDDGEADEEDEEDGEYPEANLDAEVPNISININNKPISAPLAQSDQDEKWEDAVGSPQASTSSSNKNIVNGKTVNQHRISPPPQLVSSSPSAVVPVPSPPLNNNTNNKPSQIHHSHSDDLLNHYEQHYLKEPTLNSDPMNRKVSLKSSSPISAPSNPNALDPFQTLLNQILADAKNDKGHNGKHSETPNNYSNSNQNSANESKQHINDLTQIKYLKSNYNITYYPSDFINYSENLGQAISPTHKNSSSESNGKMYSKNELNSKSKSNLVQHILHSGKNNRGIKPSQSLFFL